MDTSDQNAVLILKLELIFPFSLSLYRNLNFNNLEGLPVFKDANSDISTLYV